ncbi:MAG TPA: hypothetical protein VM912_06425 [Terriglobales bacterium]|nr:hypothetical protein [Terriglobales bacterium]
MDHFELTEGSSSVSSVLKLSIATCLIVSASLCACSGSRSQQSSGKSPQQETNYSAQAYKGKLEPDDGQWIRPAKDFASTRYSTLDQINTFEFANTDAIRATRFPESKAPTVS